MHQSDLWCFLPLKIGVHAGAVDTQLLWVTAAVDTQGYWVTGAVNTQRYSVSEAPT
jgi:hypothetical protein